MRCTDGRGAPSTEATRLARASTRRAPIGPGRRHDVPASATGATRSRAPFTAAHFIIRASSVSLSPIGDSSSVRNQGSKATPSKSGEASRGEGAALVLQLVVVRPWIGFADPRSCSPSCSQVRDLVSSPPCGFSGGFCVFVCFVYYKDLWLG